MTISFPTVDPTALQVVWAPLLVRPIAQGPECFVAAIAAHSNSGEVGCYPLVDRRRMSALSRDHVDTLSGVVDASVDSLRRHLESQIDLDGWLSPFEGVTLGNPATAYVHKFSEVFGVAARVCSAFGDLRQFDETYSEPKAVEDPWAESVPELLGRMTPTLSNSINAQLALAGAGHAMTFTFYGVHLAANFVLLNPQRMAASMREARAHLWNLSLVAEAPDLLIRPGRLELFAGLRVDDSRTRGGIEELAVEAKWRHVGVTRVESSEHAAEQIVALAGERPRLQTH